ncbi:MAG: acyl carrier protein [Campylobacteraceae bacterium]|nr:acyl carrier protein [Campylobacteraceae bacterium]
MEYLKLVFCSVLAMTYSNVVMADNCETVKVKVLDALAKSVDVSADEVAIDKTFYDQSFSVDLLDIINVVVDVEESLNIELKDEDVVDPMVYFDDVEIGPRLKSKVTVKEFQDVIYKACIKSLS